MDKNKKGTEGEGEVEEKEGEVKVEGKKKEGEVKGEEKKKEGEVDGKKKEGEVKGKKKEGEVKVEEKKKEGEVKVEGKKKEVKVKVEGKKKVGEVEGKKKEGKVKVGHPIDQVIRYNEYLEALREFEKDVEPIVTMASINGFRSEYEHLLLGLLKRPKFDKMSVVFGVDELATFCRAVSEGWRLWPGKEWVEMQRMLDYLCNSMVIEDIKRMEVPFLLTLKDIAIHEWTGEDHAGHLMSTHAKKIIFLWKEGAPLGMPVASTSRTSRHSGPSLVALEMMSALVMTDREICRGVDCLEVQGKFDKFLVCEKCQKEAYHSKECRDQAWETHKEVCNKVQ